MFGGDEDAVHIAEAEVRAAFVEQRGQCRKLFHLRVGAFFPKLLTGVRVQLVGIEERAQQDRILAGAVACGKLAEGIVLGPAHLARAHVHTGHGGGLAGLLAHYHQRVVLGQDVAAGDVLDAGALAVEHDLSAEGFDHEKFLLTVLWHHGDERCAGDLLVTAFRCVGQIGDRPGDVAVLGIDAVETGGGAGHECACRSGAQPLHLTGLRAPAFLELGLQGDECR